MFEMKVNDKGIEVKVIGSLPEITNEFLNGFKKIYESLKESDEMNAEVFGVMITSGILAITQGKDSDGMLNSLFEEIVGCYEQDDEEEEEDDDSPKYSVFAKFMDKIMECRRK